MASEIALALAVRGQKDAKRALEDTGAAVEDIGTKASRTGVVASAALSKLQSLGGAVARGLRTSATAITAVGAAATVSLVKTGIAYNDLEQKSKAAFTTILGSEQAAKDMMSSIRDFGRTSPFPRQAFISATQQLLAFGYSADDIIPTLKRINDATAAVGGNADTIATITDVFAKIKSAGRVGTEDLNRLSAAGINGFEAIAKASGKSIEQVRKDLTKGNISAEQGLSALATYMDTRFAGASEKVKETWSGAVDRVKGAWRDLGSAIVEPFISTGGGGAGVRWANGLADGLRKAANAAPLLIQLLQTGSTDQGALAGMLGPNVAKTASTVALKIREIAAAMASFDWGAVAGVFKSFAGGDSAAMKANLSGIGDSLKTLQPAFVAFAAQAPSLSDVLGVFGGVLRFAADNVQFLTKHMKLIVIGFIAFKAAAVTANVAATVLRYTQVLVTATTLRQIGANRALAASNLQLAAAIRGVSVAELQNNGAQNAGLLTRIRTTAVMAAQKVALVAGAVATGVATAAQWVYNTSLTAGAAAMTALTWPVLAVVAGLALLAAGLVYAYHHSDTFRGVVDGLWAKLKEAWAWIQGTAVPVLKTVFAGALDVARQKFDSVRDGIAGFVDKVKDAWNWVKKLADQLQNSAIGKAFSAANSGIANLFGGGRASGGPVSAGTTYLVGERGPELFTTQRSGQILSTADTMAAVNANPPNLRKSEMPSVEELQDLNRPLHVTVVSTLDGREVARNSATHYGSQMARS